MRWANCFDVIKPKPYVVGESLGKFVFGKREGIFRERFVSKYILLLRGRDNSAEWGLYARGDYEAFVSSLLVVSIMFKQC